jgi:hypothetical protein
MMLGIQTQGAVNHRMVHDPCYPRQDIIPGDETPS